MSDETSQTVKPSSVIQGDQGAETAQVWISAFLIVILGAIVFAPAFSIPFHGEELALFVDSTALHRVVAFPEAAPLLPGAPLTLLSYALNYNLPPSPAIALHGFTVLLHLLNGVLVFLFARALLPKGTAPFLSLSAGAAFVVFAPLAEVVCYLPDRPAVLAATFGLLSMLAILRALRSETTHYGWLAVALVLLIMAAGASFFAISLAGLLIVLCFFVRGGGVFKTHGAIPMAIIGVVVLFCAVVMPGPGDWSMGEGDATPMVLGVALLLLLIPFLLNALKNPSLRTGGGIAVAVAVLVSAYFANSTASAMTDPVSWWAGRTLPMDTIQAAGPDVRENQAAYRTYQARAVMGAANAIRDANTRSGLLEAARAPLQEALELTPGDARRAKLLGAVLQDTGQTDEAIAVLEEALRADPWDQESTLRLGALMDGRARGAANGEALQRALDYFDRAEALGPLPGDFPLRAAMAHASLGDFETALPALRAVVGKDEKHPLAPALKQFEAMNTALANLRKREQEARKKDPGGVEMILARAESAAIRGRVMEAFYLLDLVLQRAPGNPEAWSRMGLTCARMDDTAGFLKEWGSGAEVSLDAWQGLAAQCAASGMWQPALAYLRHGAGMVPNAPLPLVMLADIALKLGQAQRAQAMLEQAAKDHPGSPEPWLKLADIAIAAKNMAPVAGWLAEAETRGADPEVLKARRDQAGVTPQDAQRPQRTIMR